MSIQDHDSYPETREDGLLPNVLTTPIPYLSYQATPNDLPEDAVMRKYHFEHPQRYYLFKKSGIWILQNHGPNKSFDLPASFLIQAAEAEKGIWIINNIQKYKYDPTNGTKTRGDVFRTRQ